MYAKRLINFLTIRGDVKPFSDEALKGAVYLRGNKLAITVFESYDDIVDKSCAAWNFFADDPERVASITSRTWATVIP